MSELRITGKVVEVVVNTFRTTDYTYHNTTNLVWFVNGEKVSVDVGTFIPGVYRVNPYSVWQEELDAGDCHATKTHENSQGKYVVTAKGPLFYGVLSSMRYDFPAVNTSSISNIALQKAYAKLGASQLNLGEDIGELKQTLAMLRHPLSSLRKFLNKDNQEISKLLKKLFTWSKTGHWEGARTAAEATKLASSTWLEVRYGLRPLMYLVQDVVDMVKKVDSKRFSATSIRSVHATAKDIPWETGNSIVPFNAGIYMTYKCTARAFMYSKAYASVQYTQSRPPTLIEEVGLSAPYLPEVAWELTKLSFVWDWFVTIGPWLGSYRVKPTISVLGNTVGVKTVKDVSCTAGKCRSVFAGDTTYVPFSGSGKFTNESYVRQVNVSLPVLPQFTGGSTIGLFKTIDGLALIAQKLLG